ncbi:hypothetical protein SMIR_27865 [Streptomyces mirabilis]|uniref:hypothetical protein n=1 Tax=Streptomyces mirabilis TaxID=68239 RepID=UPI00143E2E71|nr:MULTISPECIES: hypothetical protein [Streptomyces]QIY70648.1 hypothetical protein HEP84_17050 [Streptomyces sp. RLB1-33]QUW82441.1 hypothetical protein SMIR_27865 [Streptomyces mirabilis]
MQSQDVAQRSAASPGPVVDVEQAEAALVEHYPRLVRLAYLVLPPSLGRNRRVLTAHALTQRALPRGRTTATPIPAQATGRDGDPGYALVRLKVVRTALEAGVPLRRAAWPKRSQLPPLLPQVWGLRLFPRSGGADELALDQRLSALSGAARAAYVLRGLEKLPDPDVRKVLTAAGVDDPRAALKEAGGVEAKDALLLSPEFDPCSLHARPTDLMRRRQHTKAAIAAGVAAAVCGALLALPSGGWGPDGAAAPSYAQNPAAEAALDPGRVTRIAPTAWRSSARTDFSVWPARGNLAGDTALLRRALAVWARPGESVQVSATPGTPSGAPAGPPQLLYAGDVDQARVVLFYDGLRIARYAEPRAGTGGAALDFARVDGATGAEAEALVLDRADGNVRYLTAPWVTGAAERDLMKPTADPTPLTLSPEGVSTPLAGPAPTGACTSWNVMEATDASGPHLLTDLGELIPAHLTSGPPAAPHDAAGPAALRNWAPFACSLSAVRSQGVRSVNAWQYAQQPLPDASGQAAWVCTRADTWRGDGTLVLAQFHTAGGAYGAVAAKAENSPACGGRDPHVLAGVLWKSGTGDWYLLAAGSKDTASISTTGGVSGSARGALLAVRTKQGGQAGLKGTLTDGRVVSGLR